nr:crinkler 15 [Plasmopara viticola]
MVEQKESKKVKLRCGVYGKGTVFSVEIEHDAEVEALQEAIVNKKKDVNDRFNVDPALVTLYLARKNGAWLKDDDSLDDLLSGEKIDLTYRKMRPSWKLDDDEYFKKEFQPGDKEIHILVELPEAVTGVARRQSGLWLVRGLIANALNTKGVRCRLYRLAGSYIGYYDPSRRTGDKDSALWYEDKALCVHVLFKTGMFNLSLVLVVTKYDSFVERDALQFDNALQEEPVTLGSPLYQQEVITNIAQVDVAPIQLQRIYFVHYDAQESESPQDTTYIHFVGIDGCTNRRCLE